MNSTHQRRLARARHSFATCITASLLCACPGKGDDSDTTAGDGTSTGEAGSTGHALTTGPGTDDPGTTAASEDTTAGTVDGFDVHVTISGVNDFTNVHVAFVAESDAFVDDDQGARIVYTWRGQQAFPIASADATVTLTTPDPTLLIGTTCADGGLEIDGVPFAGCQDDPADRYTILTPLAFRDLNGNGQLDQASPGDPGYLDEFIGWPEITGSEDPALGFDRVFYVERFENTTVRSSRFGAGFAYYPDAAFEPGFHLIERNAEAPANCTDDCLSSDEAACDVAENDCLGAGGTSDECFVAFMECMYQPSAACLESCRYLADAPESVIAIPARDREAEPFADGRLCVEYPFSAPMCPESLPDPDPADACAYGGSLYADFRSYPGDSAVACALPYECGDLHVLPLDATPPDWPCDVTAGMLGASCGPDSPDVCHYALACIDATCQAIPDAPAQWTCAPEYYGDHTCDCGCGVFDIDCADATVDACDYCDDAGSCSIMGCPGTIDPEDNSTCT